jgi:hypothetical protein
VRLPLNLAHSVEGGARYPHPLTPGNIHHSACMAYLTARRAGVYVPAAWTSGCPPPRRRPTCTAPCTGPRTTPSAASPCGCARPGGCGRCADTPAINVYLTPAINEGCTRSLRISHTSRRAPLQPVPQTQVPCTPYHPPNIAGVCVSYREGRGSTRTPPCKIHYKHTHSKHTHTHTHTQRHRHTHTDTHAHSMY